jgi:hypothetical protein
LKVTGQRSRSQFFSNYALFLIDIVSVPYKKGLLPHVCTVTCKAMNI